MSTKRKISFIIYRHTLQSGPGPSEKADPGPLEKADLKTHWLK